MCKWCNLYPDCQDKSGELGCVYIEYIDLIENNYREIKSIGLAQNRNFTLGTVQPGHCTVLGWVPCSDEDHSECFAWAAKMQGIILYTSTIPV